MSLQEHMNVHRRFWRGEGPSLILIPTAEMVQYDTDGYRERFEHPELMWEAEMRRARPVLDWPTDGIPTVRPNLGVVFVPATAGQDPIVEDGQMPWPGKPLGRDAITAVADVEIRSAPLMQRAETFYAVHRASGEARVAAYLPDTQGVFDIAHMLYGQAIFYDLADDPVWIHELMEISLDLYLRGSQHLKAVLGEPPHEMIHGHGTPQGVYFPGAGVRISEDTATLLSPSMIEKYLLPYIERAVAPFGGGFAHYCGRHPFLHQALCRLPGIRAIDLGNSERYDCRWIMEQCAQTDTVLCSRVAALEGEDWVTYIRRVAGLVRDTGARCILRPMVFSETREECAAMRDLWHELTS